ncbi:MAG: hypothetical protein IJI57_05465 [Flexilinea sp.]|nr:hypothetical protein [Flexilinea sp.]
MEKNEKSVSDENPGLDNTEETEEYANLDICPNCLEPNTENLAVCKYCGMPLHKGVDPDSFTAQETEEELAANRAAAVPEQPKKQKKQENGFRRVMPWLGLYLIYYAITGCFDINRQIKAAEAEGQTVNTALAYGAQVIWLAAGLLMAWPLIKKGWRKLRHLPDEDETEEQTETDNTEVSGETGTAAERDENSEALPEAAGEETGPEASGDEADETSELEADAEPADVNDEVPQEPDTTENRLINEDGTEEENADANWL